MALQWIRVCGGGRGVGCSDVDIPMAKDAQDTSCRNSFLSPKTNNGHCSLRHFSTPWCDHPTEKRICLSCKEVLCSRFINGHMLEHYENTGHCLAISYGDISVWFFSCDAYLDAQVIAQLRPAYETGNLLKFRVEPLHRFDGNGNELHF